ncbi:MAG: hypothetical protein JWS12_413 [Candidatus Saccharibacteria bacterium]|nr:hypothetical protein [Candidatus Saccharibacteria bacterium]
MNLFNITGCITVHKAKPQNQKGFTIVELMIATTVFSVILLVSSVTLIQISRFFQKGTTVNSTQEATRNIVEELSESVQFGKNIPNDPPANSGTKYGICIDNIRFNYALNNRVDTTTTPAHHALWRDNGSCTPPSSLPNLNAALPAGGRELVPPGMQIVALSVSKDATNDRLWTITLRLVSGSPDMFKVFGNPSSGCISTLLGGQFCADVTLSTTVYRRLQ